MSTFIIFDTRFFKMNPFEASQQNFMTHFVQLSHYLQTSQFKKFLKLQQL